jgi:hypothetical protein
MLLAYLRDRPGFLKKMILTLVTLYFCVSIAEVGLMAFSTKHSIAETSKELGKVIPRGAVLCGNFAHEFAVDGGFFASSRHKIPGGNFSEFEKCDYEIVEGSKYKILPYRLSGRPKWSFDIKKYEGSSEAKGK